MLKLSSLILFGACLAVRAPAQPPLSATIDASQTRPPISPLLYGQFIEQLGNVINRGIWAEMVDDRKFYYAITTEPPPGFPTHRRFFRPHRWKPVGPDDSVLMDTNHPFTGMHTPLIRLDGSEPRGIQQAGFAVLRGRSYTGHLMLAGDHDVKVAVRLIWGTNANDRQTVTLHGLRATYAKFPVKFTAGANTDNARLEITGTGRGTFHIGAVSLMPADNIDGFRRDVILALRQLHSGVYRFPGGNFVSNFNWRNAIGNRDKRPPRWNYAWNFVQPNDVGLDEFMVFCHLIGVEPYITVNAGLGDAQSAAAEVQYANGAVTTPMGRLRAENGHPKPYRDHFGTIPVVVTGNSPQLPPQFPVGGEQPRVNAGSPTYPLDVVAAWSADRKTLAVAVLNPTESEHQLAVSFKGVELTGKGTLWRMAPSSVDATIQIGHPPQVEIEKLPANSVPGTLTIAPISVNIYDFAVK